MLYGFIPWLPHPTHRGVQIKHLEHSGTCSHLVEVQVYISHLEIKFENEFQYTHKSFFVSTTTFRSLSLHYQQFPGCLGTVPEIQHSDLCTSQHKITKRCQWAPLKFLTALFSGSCCFLCKARSIVEKNQKHQFSPEVKLEIFSSCDSGA